MAYTQDTYLLQASFTPEQIDALYEEGYKAYDRFAEAYLNYKNEPTKPATFTVYGGSYTMKNSEVPVEIAERTNMTISSVLRDGTYYNENTSFALTATDFINNGTLSISKAAEDESLNSVTFTSNATFTNNNSVTVSNAIFDVANVVNTATFNLTDGAMFDAGTVINSGTFNLTGDAEFFATTVTNSGTIKLTDAGFDADVANTGAIYVYGKDTEIDGEFTGTGSINYMAGTSGEKKGAQKNAITGDNTINFLTQTDGNRRFFTASDFDVAGTEINIVGTSVSFSGNTTLTAGELNVASYTNEAGTKTYAGAVKVTGRTVGELIAKNVSLNIGNLNGEITLTDVEIKGSIISGEVQDENNASLVMKDAVSISGENVFNADIANSGALSIAGSEDVPTSLVGVQTLTNSGSGKVTIDGKAEVTVESIVNKNAGLITVSNGATLNAGSISNKKAGTYVQTIAVEGGTLIADSVNTTGANFNVTGESTLEIGKDDAAGLTGTITLGDADTAANTATLSDSFVKGGALDVAGTVTFAGENTLSDITVNGKLAIAENAILDASSLTVNGTLSTVTNATVSATNGITAEGKDLTFLSSNVSAKTITANSVVFRNATTLNIGTITEGTTVTIRSKQADTGTRAMVTGSSVGKGSVTTMNLAGFSGTNDFDVINNIGKLTVAGSLTANSITNSENATFTVSAAETELNIGKFTGTITFADGATLGDSSFGADSDITATNFAIAEGAAVTLTVGEATKLNANISSGTINLVSGFDDETAPEWDLYQLINGTIGADVTFTVDGAQAGKIELGGVTYGLIKLDTGLWLTEGQDNETLYINASYAGLTPGAKTSDGHIYGYNAFASLRDSALSYSATGVDQDVKAAAENAKNLVLTGAITNGRTLFYTDQPTVTITTGEGGASFTERLYLMHDIIYKKDGDSFVVYDKDGVTPIAQATLPEFILAEGAKLNGGSMLKVGESLDKSDYDTDTGKFTRTAGAVKLTVNGDIKSFIQVNPYSSATVSKTGSVISEYNGTGVTQDEDQQCTYIRVNGSLTVNGDAEAEVKELQFKMQRLSFADGGTLALNNTNAQFSRIRFYDENFTIPTGTATITVTNSTVNDFAGNKLNNIEGGYNFFVYGASETAEVKSEQTVVLTLDNSVMNVSDKAVFNPNANTTINVTNGSALTAGKVVNAGAIIVAGASSSLTAGTIENSRAITVTNSTLSATVVDTSAEGATFTVGGTSTLNISGTSSSLTGIITLADEANVTATIVKGGTLNVAAETAATLAEGSSVASAITNAGALTLNSVTKTGKITNNGTVSGSASTVGGITNNAGSVTLTGKSFSSVSVKAGTVSLTAENAETKAIAVGSITNGTKGTKSAEAIDGTFAADGNVTGSGAITNYAGSINVTGDLTLTPNKNTGLCPAITNGSIYTSGTTVRVGVGSIEVGGDLTAGDITNYHGVADDDLGGSSIVVTGDLVAGATQMIEEQAVFVGAAIMNGTELFASTDAEDKAFITAANITAASIMNYGTVGSTAEDKPNVETIELTGALVNKKYGEVFAEELSAASIENEGGIIVKSIDIDGVINNNGKIELNPGEGFITIEAAEIINAGTINTMTTEGSIDADTIVNGSEDNVDATIISGKISGDSINNAGSIEAGSIEVGKAATGAAAAVAGYINNSGMIGNSTASVASIELNGGNLENTAGIYAGTINAGDIVNTGSISAVNVTAATVTTAGASFNVSGTASLNISKKLTGTITLDNGATVTAMVKGGTLDVEDDSTVSLVGEAGNTAAVTNLGELTIAGGVFGAVTNKQVVVDDETTVSGTLTVAAAEGADAIQTGAFVNNAGVSVESAFTVKGNFTNSGTITIDAGKFDLGAGNTVKVISVTGTLTNNGDFDVKNDPEGKIQVFVKNDGDNKGVYLFGGDADMTELLVYSELANEYAPGQSFSFAGQPYVYAVNAFASANAITQIADDTEFIHFVPQDEVYGNLNLNLSATQDLTVDMINATGKLVADPFKFNNLNIASEVTEPNDDDDEGITAGYIEFVNDVATIGTNSTVYITGATAVFEDADFSDSKSVTIQENADVTFGGEFKAKATTIKDSEVSIAGGATATTVTIDDSVVSIAGGATANTVTIKNGSEVDFEGTVTIGTEGSTVTVLSITDSRVNADEDTKTDATIVKGNVSIKNSDMDFDGAATINGTVTITNSEVEFDRDTTISGKLTLDKNSSIEADQGFSFTAGSSQIDGKFYATNKDDENPSGNMSVNLGTLTGTGKIFTDVSSTLAFELPGTKPFSGTIDVDVTGLTATKTVAPATITGITEALRNNNLTISGKNASDNWAKYFTFDAEGKTLTLIKEATNVITAKNDKGIVDAAKYSWTVGTTAYRPDRIIVDGSNFANATYFTVEPTLDEGVTAEKKNIDVTVVYGEFAKIAFGGEKVSLTDDPDDIIWTRSTDLNLTIENGNFTKNLLGGDNIKQGGVYRRKGDSNLTIKTGTFGNDVAAGLVFNPTSDHMDDDAMITVENTNLTISGGEFNGFVYGGNYAINKSVSGSLTVKGDSTVTLIAGENGITFNKSLYVGSYGYGKVKGNTELVITGEGTITVADKIWGGCSGDFVSEGIINNAYISPSMGDYNQKRNLTFTGFDGDIDCNNIRAFSNVNVLNKEIEIDDKSAIVTTYATLSDKVNLSDVSNWTFDFGSTLSGSFKNDFSKNAQPTENGGKLVYSGDTLVLNLADANWADEEYADGWTLFDYISDSAADTIGGFSSVTAIGLEEALSFEWNKEDAWIATYGEDSYSLSIAEITKDDATRNAMVLTHSIVESV